MLSDILSKSGVSLERLGSFHEVAERGSISAAAAGNASRQSLISRQISELEACFGFSLLKRDSRPHQLTEEGEDLARLCREFFVGMDACVNRWTSQERTVSLVAGESLLQWLILPLIRSRSGFRKQNICFTLRNLRTRDAVRALLEGKADLALVRADALPAGLDHEGEFLFQYRLNVPNALRAGLSGSPGIEALRNLPLVLLEGDGLLANAVREEAKSAGVRLDVRLECSSYPLMAEAIESMGFAGFLPQFAPPLRNTSQIDLPEIKRLNRTLTLAWMPRRLKNRPEIAKVVKALL